MDHPFENLSPERFQQFCQALLANEFPRLQCFPVAQPDGGRDAQVYHISESREIAVFQVKFVRRPQAEPDPHNWLISTMEGESANLGRLRQQGIVEYFLLTNISGTAHPAVGSIDRLDSLLRSRLGDTRFFVWWRDDLNRRLENAWALKWSYPELMTGSDMIRVLLESRLDVLKEQRSAMMRAFVRHQFDADQDVRFKQVELQNRLLDLFIDVPIQPRDPMERRKSRRTLPQALLNLFWSGSEYYDDSVWAPQDERYFGAASLLLREDIQSQVPSVVLEGAPGQGKSTIVQYLCQVHRMRIVNDVGSISKLPAVHRDSPLRLPIKVDLRDFATWQEKKNPFSVDEPDSLPAGWNKALESFLSALIENCNGGARFTPVDLLAVSTHSALLLVFDGLDEVADIAVRKRVVDEITKGVSRISENALSVQAIVTSRPAAFANSPGMPRTKYVYLQLLSLTRSIIEEYADKWLKAKGVSSKQGAEYKKTLRSRLDQPHLKELARNPMQLAILLSLILTRGTSLPDKRTALYDSYIDLFFNREAEKSEVVGEHRDLLIDIHQYLAWIMHTESEDKSSRGSIATERLQKMVEDYLRAEEHNPGLAQILFGGMVERVVALVSRVEGTYEFEVQPLREYFAAKFLYVTAPHSPSGAERRGSKPDRFDVISKNFYWLNVTRFFAGCYSKGELASLVERLHELCESEPFAFTNHPMLLAISLLQDWVFTQNPRSVSDVVRMLLMPGGVRYLASQWGGHTRSAQTVLLHSKCGRDEFVQGCLSLLLRYPSSDRALALIAAAVQNMPDRLETGAFWERGVAEAMKDRRTSEKWLEYGHYLGALQFASAHVLWKLVDPSSPSGVAVLIRSGRFDAILHTDGGGRGFLEAVLEGSFIGLHRSRVAKGQEHFLGMFLDCVDPKTYASVFSHPYGASLKSALERNFGVVLDSGAFLNDAGYKPEHLGGVRKFLIGVDPLLSRPTTEWYAEIEPWTLLVEQGRQIFGEQKVFYMLAAVACGVKATGETCKDASHLLQNEIPLCRRARYSRWRSTNERWWRVQLSECSTSGDAYLALVLLFSWTKISIVVALIPVVEQVVSMLRPGEAAGLIRMVRQVRTLCQRSPAEDFDVSNLPQNLSLNLVCLLESCTSPRRSVQLYQRYLRDQEPPSVEVLEASQYAIYDSMHMGIAGWKPELRRIQESYAVGVVPEPHVVYYYRRQISETNESFSLEIAREIMCNPEVFPTFLVNLAEERWRREASLLVTSVREQAERERWFEA